jgi:hypothetical protein
MRAMSASVVATPACASSIRRSRLPPSSIGSENVIACFGVSRS